MEIEDYLKIALFIAALIPVSITAGFLLDTYSQNLQAQTQRNMVRVEWSFDNGESWQSSKDNSTVDLTFQYDRLVVGATYHPYMRVTNMGDVNITLTVETSDPQNIFREKVWNYNRTVLAPKEAVVVIWTLTVNPAYNLEGPIHITIIAVPVVEEAWS